MSLHCCLSSGKCSIDSVRARNTIDDETAEVIRRRTGLSRINAICQHHFHNVVDMFHLNQLKCCDPFGKHKKPASSGLQVITLQAVHKFQAVLTSPLVPGKKLCPNCQSHLHNRFKQFQSATQNPLPDWRQENQASASAVVPVDSNKINNEDGADGKGPGSMDYDEIFPTPPDTALKDLNECMSLLGLDACDMVKLKKVKRYAGDLLDSIELKVVSKLEKASGLNFEKQFQSDSKNFQEMLAQLKTAYYSTTDKTTRVRILSVLPASWSIKQIADSFGVSMATVRSVRALVDEQGILPTPHRKQRTGLSEELENTVKSFYEENSRQLPGIKDHVTVKEGDKKVQKQKMLVLMTLKELYTSFKSEYPELKISFSKFAELRPRQCVLAGASGTHSVCVCVYHENFSLLIEGAHLQKQVDGKTKFMSTSDVLNLSLCDQPQPTCYLGGCQDCPGFSVIKERLEVHFDERMQTEVQYKKWVSGTDRARLITCVSSTEEFIEHVEEILPPLLSHHFIAKEQALFLKTSKTKLKRNSCIVIGDYSENYTPCHQAAIQETHWDKTQITLHPCVCYYLNELGKLEVFNFVVVSDYNDHETLAVNAFQHRLIAKLKEKIPDLKEIHYFTDGCKAQYKNRYNALNLRMHEEDFQVVAVWHFFASCHGKGPCDGLAGLMKRLARLESLRRLRIDGILSAKQFYEWAKGVFGNSTWVEFVTKEEIEAFKLIYGSRYTKKNVPALEGITSAHCLIPLSIRVMQMKQYSGANTCHYVYHGDLGAPEFCDLHGFIMVSEDDAWHLACVVERNETEKKVTVKWLERAGPLLFKFPEVDRIKEISLSDIISVVNVEATTEITFKLSRKCVTFGSKEQLKRHPPLPKKRSAGQQKRK